MFLFVLLTLLAIITDNLQLTDVMARLGIASCNSQLYAEKQVLVERLKTLTNQNEKLQNKIEKIEHKLEVTSEQNIENTINVRVCESNLSSWGRVIGWVALGFFLRYILGIFVWWMRWWYLRRINNQRALALVHRN